MADQPRRLDETIPGGEYLAADGKTRVDAWGTPITTAKPASKPAPKRSTTKKASTS